MRTKRDFSIAFKGLKAGHHHFEYLIDDNFFEAFENSPVKTGKLIAEVEFIKEIDHFKIDVAISGAVATNCDRCTADINLPLAKTSEFLIKFSEEEIQDAEIVYISSKVQVLDVSNFIYESIVLAIPLIKVYDCDNEESLPCNQKVLDYLYDSDEEPTEPSTNPLWDKLNDLKFNDN